MFQLPEVPNSSFPGPRWKQAEKSWGLPNVFDLIFTYYNKMLHLVFLIFKESCSEGRKKESDTSGKK